MNGPLAGTVLTVRRPDVKTCRIPITDDDGNTYWHMFEKDTSGLRWLGWSTSDGMQVDAPAKSARARQITNIVKAECAKLGITLQARCMRGKPKPRPLTPNDLGPYSHDDIYGQDEIKDWEPPVADDDDE